MLKPFYQIIVDGQDVSSVFRPILLDLSVSLSAGGTSDSVSITVDDAGGRVAIPRDDAFMTVSMGWEGGVQAEVFRGKVNDVRCSVDRSSGRTMSVGATGMDTKGRSKEPKLKHYDDMTVGDILKKAAQMAGYDQVRVSEDIASKVVPYFLQKNESLVHVGQRLAGMFGATFKVMGDRVVLVKRNAMQSATGRPLVAIDATWGVNLLAADVKPYLGRPRARKTRARWYDRTKARWETVEIETGDDEAVATMEHRYMTSGKVEAEGRAESDAAEADRNRGEGNLQIVGEPRAIPEAPCNISGVRSGVDGAYIIDQVTHSLSRGSGFLTDLAVKRPEAS